MLFMAYDQSSLQNIGGIRDKIIKRKLDKKFGTEEGAKKFQEIESFRARAAKRKQPKVKTMETDFVSSIKPFEKQTIKFDVPEKTRKKQKSKLSKAAGKVGERIKYGAVELGHTVLDKLPLSGATVGKRRVFIDDSGTKDYLFGKLTGLNEEKGHYKRYAAGNISTGENYKVKHFDRMTNKEWRKLKKRKYTKKQRLKNLAVKGSFALGKAATAAATAIGYDNSNFGVKKGRRPGQGS